MPVCYAKQRDSTGSEIKESGIQVVLKAQDVRLECVREEVPARNFNTPKFRGWEDEEEPAKEPEKEQPNKAGEEPEVVSALYMFFL